MSGGVARTLAGGANNDGLRSDPFVADPIVPEFQTVAFYKKVTNKFGGMRPPSIDVGHDIFTALAHWVEDAVAPAQAMATMNVGNDPSKGIGMQRPVCPYPQRAGCKGAGSAGDAANFVRSVDKT